jgi:hypothetical protein
VNRATVRVDGRRRSRPSSRRRTRFVLLDNIKHGRQASLAVCHRLPSMTGRPDAGRAVLASSRRIEAADL